MSAPGPTHDLYAYRAPLRKRSQEQKLRELGMWETDPAKDIITLSHKTYHEWHQDVELRTSGEDRFMDTCPVCKWDPRS